MGNLICSNALMSCSFGMIPSAFQATNCMQVMASGIVGNVMDATPANLMNFGMCMSMANPMVASATAIALGVLTPQPCLPVPMGLWITPKMNILIKNAPALSSDAKLFCAYGGIIQFNNTPCMNVVL